MTLSFTILAVAAAMTITGAVDRVRDGDTVEVDGTPIRLHGVAAPELSEPGGSAAKSFMTDLVARRTVRCQLTGRRSYDRLIGRCFLDGQDIGAAVIGAGLARDCPRFSGGRFAADETEASRRLPLPPYCRAR